MNNYFTKTIRYENNQIGSKTEGSKSSSINKKEKDISKTVTTKKSCLFKLLIITLISSLVIAGSIALYFLVFRKPPDPVDTSPILNICSTCPEKLGPLEMQTEYKLKTNVNDLFRIYINQKYYQDIKTDGTLSNNFLDRKTDYHIYIMKEIPAPEEAEYYYNKTYLCSIAIASECLSGKDEYCIPQKKVDLINQDHSRIRNLQNIDLSNFPIPLCFFNLTDNNVITSISCHKDLSEEKINSIVLDLYFFRPPGILRIDKKGGNITITTSKEGKNDVIRETNGGMCNINNAFNSFCTTDMNTTKDPDGNLISYNELATTNLTTDQNNYFIKNKYTYLLDKTKIEQDFSPEQYNETLNILHTELKKYMKEYVQFSLSDFKELYSVSKGIENETKHRNLNQENENENINYESSKEIFRFKHYAGVQVAVRLSGNSGLGSENLMASSDLLIDDKKNNLAKSLQSADINNLIKKLKTLSEAGNKLAYNLYKNITDKLNNITDIITNNIPSLNNMITYQELSDIFDSTFSIEKLKYIPHSIIDETDNLLNELEKIHNEIENGGLNKNIKILNEYIYQFIRESHELVNKISNNIRNLGNLIKSPKQTISDISNYYLNHTSNSYVNTIKEARDILYYYYMKERDLIYPEVEKMIKTFEDATIESLGKQINLTKKLNLKLENKNLTIKDGNEDDYRKILVNLKNSNNYISNIINLFKQKIINQLDLKNGYFISQYDIESNNETFYQIIEESLAIAQNLDNNEYVDTLFDEIMREFRESFVTNTKYMEEKKQEQFPPVENAPINGFKSSEQKSISSELKALGANILTSIQNENNNYLRNINEEVEKILDKKDCLNQLVLELDTLLCEESLKDFDKLYNQAFNNRLDIIKQTILSNKQLTYEYFDEMVYLTNDNKEVVRLLEKHAVDKTIPEDLPECTPTNDYHCVEYTGYEDYVYGKTKSVAYLNKYRYFKNKFENSKEFINSEIYTFIKEEYKNIVIKLKQVLLSFKKNKISDLFPDLTELNFIDDHLNIIDKIIARFNGFISDDIFNNYYLPLIKDFKAMQINNINEIEKNIENKHKIINVGGVETQNKDFCISFKRTRVFTCRNTAVYKREGSEYVCLDTWGGDNIDKLDLLSINSDTIFDNQFNDFYIKIKNKVENYNKIINEFKENVVSIEYDIIQNNDNGNYLLPIENKINSLLSEKYSNNLIKASYNYYKDLLDKRLLNLLNDISNEWISSFNILKQNVTDNLNNFTNSISEFGIMALIYEAIITQNLTKFFYESTLEHQKSEFNYTISYYYNSLIQNITSIYQFINNQIPTNKEGLNKFVNLKKSEVQEKFNNLINQINESKRESLLFNKQLNVLNTSSLNFFKTNDIFSNFIGEFSTNLKNIGNSIYQIKNGKNNDETSLACRFYLENSQNGLDIEHLYQPINDNIFIYLDLENFKELMTEKWTFDQDGFINAIENSIHNIKLEMENELKTKKEENKKILESKITDYYSKELIGSKISESYNNHLNIIKNAMINNFTIYITEALNVIKKHILDENQRINEKLVLYTNDFSLIYKSISEYKSKILNQLEEYLFKIVDNLYENILKIAYTNHIKPGLDSYLLEVEKKYKSNCPIHNFFSSSYNIGNIIYDIVNDLVNDYQNFTNYQIEFKRDYNKEKLRKEIIEEFGKLYDNEINPEFNKLLDTLNNITKETNEEGMGYTKYDFDDQMKNDIGSRINSSLEKINNNLKIIEIKEEEIKNIWAGNLDFDGIDCDSTKNGFDVFIQQKKNVGEAFSKDYNNSPQLISNFDSITSKKNEKKINNSNLLINNNNEDATSFKDKISEKIGSIKSYFKRERLGLFYCILAQFLWTTNNIILKFITKKYSTKFTNKSYLLSRGIAIVIIAYTCGKHFDRKIYKLSDFEPNIKKCLLIRSNLSFFGMSFWLLAVYYLRISTCQIIASLSPILVIFLGVFFLNEPYYNRYAFGIVLGIVGSCIIILNENKLSNNKKDDSSALSDLVIGLLSMAANISITGIVWVVNKIMATKKISLYAQLLYFGIFHTTYGFLWMLFTMDFDYSFGYLFLCSTQAILFFLGNYYNYLGLKLIDLNKISIIQYTSIVFVLILGIIFLKEKIFFSDIIGSSIIVSFMIYHAINPIK